MPTTQPRRLEGRVAIVTGAGGGIAREHARLLAAHGARVVVNDIGDLVNRFEFTDHPELRVFS